MEAALDWSDRCFGRLENSIESKRTPTHFKFARFICIRALARPPSLQPCSQPALWLEMRRRDRRRLAVGASRRQNSEAHDGAARCGGNNRRARYLRAGEAAAAAANSRCEQTISRAPLTPQLNGPARRRRSNAKRAYEELCFLGGGGARTNANTHRQTHCAASGSSRVSGRHYVCVFVAVRVSVCVCVCDLLMIQIRKTDRRANERTNGRRMCAVAATLYAALCGRQLCAPERFQPARARLWPLGRLPSRGWPLAKLASQKSKRAQR